ncbi:hypothetical protein NIES4071_95530 [Calothrix sp. NIES-4071]|nr:hypothetical protein NIES4071_95530 [Calothrix sp. NIES-4071]BAZ63818.1 hypothetical protein NIES4105_95460 [Calothrix sp. NIES-4105]
MIDCGASGASVFIFIACVVMYFFYNKDALDTEVHRNEPQSTQSKINDMNHWIIGGFTAIQYL